jgi:ribosome-binding factor A
MGQARRERVADALREEISALLQSDVRDPRVGFVTITEVRVSPDLSHARVFASVLGVEEVQRESIEALNCASGFLQRQIFRRLRLKKALSLLFELDKSVQSGARIEELLHQIHSSGESEEE